MTRKLQVYRCNVCGIVVEAVESGAGEPVCCGQPMMLLRERIEDAATEKHVPFIEPVEGGIRVRVGQNAEHPMEAKHWIQWIEVLDGDLTQRRFLAPGDKPEAEFAGVGSDAVVRELCNQHGLWANRQLPEDTT